MANATIASAQEAGPGPQPPPGPPPPRMEVAPGNDAQAKRMRMAMGRVEELRRAGKNEEARQLAERLRAAGAQGQQASQEPYVGQPTFRGQVRERQRATPPVRPVAQARMQMQKLRQAADLLQSAGYPEHAAKVRQEIERIAMDARRQAEMATARPESPAKADAGLREEMKKLRREVEELRTQLKNMNAEAESKPARERRDGDRER